MRDLLFFLGGAIVGAAFSIGIAVAMAPSQNDLLDTWKEMSE